MRTFTHTHVGENIGRHIHTALAAALVCCLGFFACGKEASPPNVLVIGVDTLRPDHLGCYGYERRTSPNIDRLAAQGAVFENTVSQCPWTLPSFSTVFTSLYPTQHGAGTLRNKMRTTFPTLASLLSDAGYSTGAVISSPVLDSGTGIARGFRFYDVKQDGPMRTADEVTTRALEWIDSEDARPFFLFLHYWDPHDPYGPPPPYDTLFDPSYTGGLGNIVNLRTLGFTSASQVGVTMSEESGRISDSDLGHAIALYDGEIAFADSMIGVLLSGLEDRGLRDNTLVVLLSDHGEEFFEHNGVGHGHTLYREVIRVPLLLAFPGVIDGNGRIAGQVRLLDVTPTILDLVGLAADPAFEGTSLAPLLRGESPVAPDGRTLFPPLVAYSEGVREGPEKKAVTAYPWKLIYELSSTDEMLFDLKRDPGESENLIAEHHDAAVPFEELLSRALFEMSEDWYIEVAGGDDSHSFDLAITAETGTRSGWVCPFKTMEDGKRVVTSGTEVLREAPGSSFEARGLTARAPVTMGFKIHAPRGIRTTMAFKMDGKPAEPNTFIGESLTNPDDMPFSLPAKRALTESASGPKVRPEPPYILVWHVEGKYGGELPADLSEDVKKELRALGYIQ